MEKDEFTEDCVRMINALFPFTNEEIDEFYKKYRSKLLINLTDEEMEKINEIFETEKKED